MGTAINFDGCDFGHNFKEILSEISCGRSRFICPTCKTEKVIDENGKVILIKKYNYGSKSGTDAT